MQLKHHHLHHHHHHDRKRSPEELLAHMSSKYHMRKTKVFVFMMITVDVGWYVALLSAAGMASVLTRTSANTT
jgi:hypothetical protein